MKFSPLLISYFITVRNLVAKVMFFTPVCLSTGWESASVHVGTPTPGEQTPPGTDTPPSRPPWEPTHPPADSYCCGRYASYWNAFLLESFEFQCKRVSVFFVASEQSLIYIFPADDVSRSCFGKFTDLDTTFRLSFTAN